MAPQQSKSALPRVPRKIKIGTDFSGMDMPVLALEMLNIPHISVFASDINDHCLQYIQVEIIEYKNFQKTKKQHAHHTFYAEANYGAAPTVTFSDVATRVTADTPPTDVYVWGAPCVTFSNAGNGAGVADPRGLLGKKSMEYITLHKPRLAIMESF